MVRKPLVAIWISAVFVLAAAHGLADAPAAAADPADSGRFVWHDLMTRDVSAARRFYGDLFGWRFEDTTRGDRPYVLARAAGAPVAGIVDVSAIASAGTQWLSFMTVADVEKTVTDAQSNGGKVLVAPRDPLPMARVAVITDPQGAPLGLAQLRRDVPDPAKPATHRFFWHEYLAKDAGQALDFYKRLVGYESSVTESRLGVDYHVLRKTRGRAGLFQLPPAAADVQPNWLPYVLVDDPAALGARAQSLGGRILVAATPERRKGSLVVIADPGGAPLALQKYPF
jgi:predicted enzyme related to lactoylglutathione lyase